MIHSANPDIRNWAQAVAIEQGKFERPVFGRAVEMYGNVDEPKRK
jgi:hypothetical protein